MAAFSRKPLRRTNYFTFSTTSISTGSRLGHRSRKLDKLFELIFYFGLFARILSISLLASSIVKTRLTFPLFLIQYKMLFE